MDLSLLLALSLCYKPSMIFSSFEIKDGESVRIMCTQPVNWSGGECRLYRKNSHHPFRVAKASDFVCVFNLSSQELLGGRPVGSKVLFTCDYQVQQFTSVRTDIGGVTVWGTSPSPRLSVSRSFVTPDESVEVTCSPPLHSVSRCHFYRDQDHIAQGPCSRNLTGQQLVVWEKPALLLPVNLTCRYYPHNHLRIRSEASNLKQLFVIDVDQVSTSMDCTVTLADDQLETFGENRWTSAGADGQTVTLQVTHGNLMINQTCVQNQEARFGETMPNQHVV
ncbi:uncharacterized protein LOC121512588 isoform X2 [Cheilinus undulatus]|uniref:uncharacterized protein LOC121512588 isoform X2 n=1 Tax=Cheilinus undulatus TaxID=241271 RepID=UPI001BD46FD4|nr:uncharacterized protein LOC121512588 isoform X2 [Cheilinus undulatus]